MKRILIFLLTIILLFGCAPTPPKQDAFKIVATLFPQYDFAREICGDTAEISLLLPPGTDSHSYDPTPQDILLLQEADLVFYTGDEMEPWAKALLSNASGRIVDVSQGVTLLSGDNIQESHSRAKAALDTDPHIWTNPQNAIIMAENICKAVSELAPSHAALYKENLLRYTEQLTTLDKAFEALVSSAPKKHIVFGGHFAMRYFTHRYGLTYTAAFDACNGETEPSPSILLDMIKKMKEEDIKAVYFEELSTPKTANLIAEETGAQALLLHSCHTLSKAEMNETYLTLMQKNLENLKIGLR